jgi:hypothetical protein
VHEALGVSRQAVQAILAELLVEVQEHGVGHVVPVAAHDQLTLEARMKEIPQVRGAGLPPSFL